MKESESMLWDGLNLPLLALQMKKEPSVKANGRISKLEETLSLEPATEQGTQSYYHKELNPTNNPNE